AGVKHVSVVPGQCIGVGRADLHPITVFENLGMIEPLQFVPCVSLRRQTLTHDGERSKGAAEVEPLIQSHVVEHFASAGSLPRSGRTSDDPRYSDAAEHAERLLLRVSLKHLEQFAQAPTNADLLNKPTGGFFCLRLDRFVESVTFARNNATPMEALNHLLGGECD